MPARASKTAWAEGLALLPTLILLASWRAWRGRAVDGGLLLACLLAAGPLLLAQYGIFAEAGDESRVRLDFLGYYRAIGEDLGLLPLKWLASLAFPLGLLLLGRAIWQQQHDYDDEGLCLGWVTLGVAWVQALIFVEDGWRVGHGNFTWGVLYAAFVLFALSLRRLLPLLKARQGGALLLLALYGLHVLAGLDWFAVNLRG